MNTNMTSSVGVLTHPTLLRLLFDKKKTPTLERFAYACRGFLEGGRPRLPSAQLAANEDVRPPRDPKSQYTRQNRNKQAYNVGSPVAKNGLLRLCRRFGLDLKYVIFWPTI